MCSLLHIFSCGHNPYYDPEKPHHTINGFRNVPFTKPKDFKDIRKWRKERKEKNFQYPVFDHEPFPKIQTNLNEIMNSPKPSVTWVGHATLLLQIQGKIILTDPQFSDRSSPVSFAGPKRYMFPSFSIHDLPKLDYVLISHDHYDHLDDSSIRQIAKKFPNTVFFTPLRYKEWLEKRNVKNIVEMDWWDEKKMDHFEFICAPVQHWTKRTPWDTNRKLWSGWIILSEDFKFFFGGDTGYSPHFKEIYKKFGSFDLAALPIGAYEPRWIMKDNHMNPQEAIQAHLDLHSKQSLGIHWGTFILTDEPYDQPPKDLQSALDEKKIPSDKFWVFQHGETRFFEQLVSRK